MYKTGDTSEASAAAGVVGEGANAIAFFDCDAARFRSLYEISASFRDRLNLFLGAVQSVKPRPARLLDFGCGPGVIAISLARLGYDVLGIDGADHMLEQGRAMAASMNIANVRFTRMSAAELSLPNETFDGIVCSSVIEYVEDDLGLVKKLAGALKPGGHIFLSVPHAGSLAGKIVDAVVLKRLLSWRSGSKNLNYSLRRYDRRKLMSSLKEIGLSVTQTTTFEFPIGGTLGIYLSRCPLLGRMMLIQARKN